MGEAVDLVIKQSGQVAVVTYVPGWAWQCVGCGWLGTGLTSERAAVKEGARHLWDDHKIAACDPEVLDGGNTVAGMHEWKAVPGTDSTDQCVRCGRYCGK